jgi:hypothetical protein
VEAVPVDDEILIQLTAWRKPYAFVIYIFRNASMRKIKSETGLSVFRKNSSQAETPGNRNEVASVSPAVAVD